MAAAANIHPVNRVPTFILFPFVPAVNWQKARGLYRMVPPWRKQNLWRFFATNVPKVGKRASMFFQTLEKGALPSSKPWKNRVNRPEFV